MIIKKIKVNNKIVAFIIVFVVILSLFIGFVGLTGKNECKIENTESFNLDNDGLRTERAIIENMQTGEKTLIIINDVRVNVGLDERDFTRSGLEKQKHGF